MSRGAIGGVIQLIEQGGLRVVTIKMLRLSRAQAEGFYAVHKERPFYGSLCDFMTSGPIVVLVLEGKDAIRRYREIMGPTNPAEASEGTIRKQYGSNIERNAVHGSDSPDTARAEISYYFSENDLNAL